MAPYRRHKDPPAGAPRPDPHADLALSDRVIHLLLIFVGALPVLHALRAGGAWGAAPTLGLCGIAIGAWGLRAASR